MNDSNKNDSCLNGSLTFEFDIEDDDEWYQATCDALGEQDDRLMETADISTQGPLEGRLDGKMSPRNTAEVSTPSDPAGGYNAGSYNASTDERGNFTSVTVATFWDRYVIPTVSDLLLYAENDIRQFFDVVSNSLSKETLGLDTAVICILSAFQWNPEVAIEALLTDPSATLKKAGYVKQKVEPTDPDLEPNICPILYIPCNLFETIPLCGHRISTTAWKKYLESMLSDNRTTFSVKCMFCASPLSQEFIERLLAEDQVAKWRERVVEDMVTKCGWAKYCSGKDCEGLLVHSRKRKYPRGVVLPAADKRKVVEEEVEEEVEETSSLVRRNFAQQERSVAGRLSQVLARNGDVGETGGAEGEHVGDGSQEAAGVDETAVVATAGVEAETAGLADTEPCEADSELTGADSQLAGDGLAVRRKDYTLGEGAQCELCGTVMCFVCGEEDHRPVPCEMMLDWQRRNQEDCPNILWVLINAKNCPQCRHPIEKNQGCMHMTCRCGHQFCWLCLGDWSMHKDNFRCNFYEEEMKVPENQLAAKQKKELQDRASKSLNKLTHHFERYVSHKNGATHAHKSIILELNNMERACKEAGLQNKSNADILYLTSSTMTPQGTAVFGPDTVRPDTVRPDTVRPDTVRPDTVRPDAGKRLGTTSVDTTGQTAELGQVVPFPFFEKMRNAAEQIIRGRRALCYSYVFGFYACWGSSVNEKFLFEDQQGQMERYLDKLQELAESYEFTVGLPFEKYDGYLMDITHLTRVVSVFFDRMVEAFSDELVVKFGPTLKELVNQQS
ncbi:IBR domain protein [Gregarina niphandrodes]|uniref:RBR-type E3 ubiquitin transferase n=1 Tax=Gregarina niphandrodes TaxID=110365 RepID=A0A023BBZ0_GRENI|nr:IBR domain protein [Gregarina niphandrodes]EZG81600.1 IBR domain protein [Gregarina niphandrodes]|eukprot:XP_011134215.1 IBR domain protein [Gregarina niphandrodes]